MIDHFGVCFQAVMDPILSQLLRLSFRATTIATRALRIRRPSTCKVSRDYYNVAVTHSPGSNGNRVLIPQDSYQRLEKARYLDQGAPPHVRRNTLGVSTRNYGLTSTWYKAHPGMVQSSRPCSISYFPLHIPKITPRESVRLASTSIPTSNSRIQTGYEGITEPTSLSQERYNLLSDNYLEGVQESLEYLAETNLSMDVEFSVCTAIKPSCRLQVS